MSRYGGNALMAAIQAYGMLSDIDRLQRQDAREEADYQDRMKVREAQGLQIGVQNGDEGSIEKAAKLTGKDIGTKKKVLGNVGNLEDSKTELLPRVAEQEVGPLSGYPFRQMEQAAAEYQVQPAQAQPQIAVQAAKPLYYYFDAGGMLRFVEPHQREYQWLGGMKKDM